MFPNVEDIQKVGKQQFDAVNVATASFSKGLQEIVAETTDYSKKAIAANTTAVEKLLGAKSVEAAIQIQTEFAQSAYEFFVAEATKIGEIYARLARDAFRPIETAYAKTSAN